MKTPAKTILASTVILIIALSPLSFNVLKRKKPVTENGFAFIELFTSEGCSSCPPADELVARIEKEYNGKSVYILAYHVDYWNQLGWKDPYSKAQFSARQRQYANWFSASGVYTPQIVVNGKSEFVGSDEDLLRKSIKNYTLQPAFPLAIQLTQLQAEKATFNYNCKNASNLVLYLACVQKSTSTKVEKGENRGRTLAHVNVVHSLDRLPIGQNLTASINLPKGFEPKNWEIIGFVQNTANGEIIAAQLVQ